MLSTIVSLLDSILVFVAPSIKLRQVYRLKVDPNGQPFFVVYKLVWHILRTYKY
ncbi:hypothetical protein SAMN04488018_10667 [Myroides marinus]|uniref:Uncharacterized protein n=1 Tax=Myroides marinus TaxID=703342 RepID=A0A1H6UB06_9FLAO|nr:hypothetical protein SAMN04488018_10667 [Myroides marinus]